MPGSASGDPAPLPAATARKLPRGVFYILAGKAANSYNVWQVSASGQRKLTRNAARAGVTEFAASPAGIVLDDPQFSGGFITPRLARLTRHGPVPLPHGGNVRSPAISIDGAIADEIPAGRSTRYKLEIRPSFTSAGHVILRTRQYLVPSWGPHNSVAAVVNGHPAFLKGLRSRLLVISPRGHAREIKTGYRLIRQAVWSQHAPAIAVSDWANHGEIIWPSGRRQPLPSGWQPAAWNPAGNALLIWRLNKAGAPSSLAVWHPRAPGQVTLIGPAAPGTGIAIIAWLPHPAAM